MVVDVPGYLSTLEGRCTPDTLRTYRARLAQFTRWMEANGRDFTRETFLAYADELQELGKRPRTLRPLYSAVKGLAEYLRGKGELGAPALGDVRAPSLDTPRRYTPSDAEIQRMWQAAEELDCHTLQERWWRGKARLIMCLLACTAIRRHELLNLLSSDIDQSGQTWFLTIRKGKGKKSRRIPINPDARAVILEWQELRREWNAAGKGRDRNPALLPVDTRRPVGEGTMNEVINRLNTRAKPAQRVTPHCIRHWAATKWASDKDASLKSISEMLGHSSLVTTEIYLHPVEEQMVAAVNNVTLGQAAAILPSDSRRVSRSAPETTRQGRGAATRRFVRSSRDGAMRLAE